MGNQPSGVAPEIHRKIKNGDVFQTLLLRGGSNLSIDMAPQNRLQDPYNLNFEIMWSVPTKLSIPTDVVLLFPHYEETDKSVLHTSRYVINKRLQEEINHRLKHDPEKNPQVRDANQMVVCWGNYCYKMSGISTASKVYLLWSKEVKGSSGSSAGRNQLFGECPVIVTTNGYYKPTSIFPVHPGIEVDTVQQPPRLIDPAKTKHYWHEDKCLFILDKREPERSGPKIVAHPELYVEKAVGELVTVVNNFESEEDEFFGEIGSDSTEEDEKGRKEPPYDLVTGNALMDGLTVGFQQSDDGESIQRKKVKKRLSIPPHDSKSEEGTTRKRKNRRIPKGGSLRGDSMLIPQPFISTSDDESMGTVPLELIPEKSMDSEGGGSASISVSPGKGSPLKHPSWRTRKASKAARKKLTKQKGGDEDDVNNQN